MGESCWKILVAVDPVKRQKLWEQFRDFYLEDANIITLFEIDSGRVMNGKFKWPRAPTVG